MMTNKPTQTSWEDAQKSANFILLKPHSIPADIQETKSQMRLETASVRACHRSEFTGKTRSLSIKQFLYDWAPPAYDHPNLWRNPKISSPEDTPLPKPTLIGNNYLWIGLDYRRKPAASIHLQRTQVEITVLNGSFKDDELVQIAASLKPVSETDAAKILKEPFAKLMHTSRHASPIVSVPTSYFKYLRDKDLLESPYTPEEFKELEHPRSDLQSLEIEGYLLDSIICLKTKSGNTCETEYYFESMQEPGAYIRVLASPENAPHKIPYPPILSEQACRSETYTLGESTVHHARSHNTENGSHSIIFKKGDHIINCIIKPAPWTTLSWAQDIAAQILSA